MMIKNLSMEKSSQVPPVRRFWGPGLGQPSPWTFPPHLEERRVPRVSRFWRPGIQTMSALKSTLRFPNGREPADTKTARGSQGFGILRIRAFL